MKTSAILLCLLLLAFFIYTRVQVPVKMVERDYNSYVERLQEE